jgi:hypothetical protein
MIDKPPRILLEPRHTTCASRLRWDQESLLLSLSLTYEDGKPTSDGPKLADTIDKHLGIGQSDYRVILGDMDILLNPGQRMKSLELRSNPSAWQPASLLPVPGNSRAVFLRFAVNYDTNGIASYRVPVRVLRDLSRRELSFVFADFAASQWAVLADELAVGFTGDLYLSELRVLDTADLRLG